jgi:hypothetical protein
MALQVLSGRPETYAGSARQKLAQSLCDFIKGRGGWITAPLSLAHSAALRFDVRSQEAAQINGELGALGLAIRFVRADLKVGPGTVTETIREGHRIEGRRRMAAPCAVTTFEVVLPD